MGNDLTQTSTACWLNAGLLSIKEVPDNLLPDMTRWRTEESLGCMATWSQDRSSPGHPPFGKREDSCKPPQGERLYPCAWFQVQDPSAVRLDLAHVSLVSANDILRIFCVSTLVSPTLERVSQRICNLGRPRVTITYDGGAPKSPPRHPGETEQKIRQWCVCSPTFVLRSFPTLRLLLGPTHRMANAMIPSYHGVTRRVTVWGACGQ